MRGHTNGHRPVTETLAGWITRKIAAADSATARIKAINGTRRGSRNHTANVVRLGRVAVRRHELVAALRVVQEWEAL